LAWFENAPELAPGIFTLECSSADEARKILDELPFVREKLISFDVIPLGPFSYFEMLFKDTAPPQSKFVSVANG
jgi:hypothetical protein